MQGRIHTHTHTHLLYLNPLNWRSRAEVQGLTQTHSLSRTLTVSHPLTNKALSHVFHWSGKLTMGRWKVRWEGGMWVWVCGGHRKGGRCVFAYVRTSVWVWVCVYISTSVSSQHCKKEMVGFIYVKCSVWSPSETIGCECCQLYALSAVSATKSVGKSG